MNSKYWPMHYIYLDKCKLHKAIVICFYYLFSKSNELWKHVIYYRASKKFKLVHQFFRNRFCDQTHLNERIELCQLCAFPLPDVWMKLNGVYFYYHYVNTYIYLIDVTGFNYLWKVFAFSNDNRDISKAYWFWQGTNIGYKRCARLNYLHFTRYWSWRTIAEFSLQYSTFGLKWIHLGSCLVQFYGRVLSVRTWTNVSKCLFCFSYLCECGDKYVFPWCVAFEGFGNGYQFVCCLNRYPPFQHVSKIRTRLYLGNKFAPLLFECSKIAFHINENVTLTFLNFPL